MGKPFLFFFISFFSVVQLQIVISRADKSLSLIRISHSVCAFVVGFPDDSVNFLSLANIYRKLIKRRAPPRRKRERWDGDGVMVVPVEQGCHVPVINQKYTIF